MRNEVDVSDDEAWKLDYSKVPLYYLIISRGVLLSRSQGFLFLVMRGATV